MSERAPSTDQVEDDDTTTDGTPRRPSALPLSRMNQAPAQAPKEIQKSLIDRRAPVTLFDRAFESQVSVPSSQVPEHAQEASRAAAERGHEDDDDDEETTPVQMHPEANTTDAATHEQTAEHAGSTPDVQPDASPEATDFVVPQADEIHQYADPVIPGVPSRKNFSFEHSANEAPADDPENAFDQLMTKAGFDPSFVEATSGPQTTETVTNHYAANATAPIKNFNAAAKSGNAPPAPPNVPPVNHNASTGFPPPPPPRNYHASGASFNPGGSGSSGSYNSAPSQAYNQAPNYNVQTGAAAQGYTDDDLHRARQSGARQGVVAGALAGGLAGNYFAKRKARNEQQKMEKRHAKELAEVQSTVAQNEQDIQRLQGNQEIRDAVTNRVVYNPNAAPERPVFTANASPTHERATAELRPIQAPGHLPEAPAVAQHLEAGVEQTAEEQAADPTQHQAEVQPHHKVRSEWLEIGVDKKGNVLQQEYGRAFQEEVAQEQTGAKTFISDPHAQHSGSGDAPAQPQGAGYYIGAGLMQSGNDDPRLDTGQVPSSQRLQSGTPSRQDPQHLLQAPKKQVVSNIANPWFWLMLIIIIVVFFAAATF